MAWIMTDYFEDRSARLIINRKTVIEMGMERAIEDEPDSWATMAYSFIKVIDNGRWKDAVIFGLKINREMLCWEIFIHDKSLDPVPELVILPEIPVKLTELQIQEIQKVFRLVYQMV